MHRHRRCIQVLQGFKSAHGYEIPEGLAEAGLHPRYESAMLDAHAAYAKLALSVAPEHAGSGDYLLPLGTRTRALFKMDFAEAVYISELRSQPQGHFSYRRIAWEMYEAVRKQHPSLAQYFRVTDVNEPVDLLKR
jgi:thymidylate synthase ThyX